MCRAESYISEIERFKREHGRYPSKSERRLFRAMLSLIRPMAGDLVLGFHWGSARIAGRYCSDARKWELE